MRFTAVTALALLLPATAFAASLRLLKTIDFANAARPEIIATADRCFVVYLAPLLSGNEFRVKIFDRDLSQEFAERTLVSTTSDYGRPTDIRVVSDGSFAYAFYETVNESRTFLWAAKYELTNAFPEVASRGPIATSTMFRVAKPGDERLDDPAPMISGSDLHVMTRFKSTYSIDGATRCRLRRFNLDLNPVGELDLDLSSVADGEARQSSIVAHNGHYYLAMTTTTGAGTIADVMWTFPSDVVLIELDENWNVVNRTLIADDPLYTETYVTGLQSDGRRFYVTYSQVILGQEFSSVIAIFDRQWNRISADAYITLAGDDGRLGLRPSIEVDGGRVYAGNDDAANLRGLVYVFEVAQSARRRAAAH